MYDQAISNENYLRGVQETAADGTVVPSTSIFPACYSGRWPHIHFEVYPSLASATSSGNKLATSQLAFPKDVCDDRLRHRRLRAERHATWAACPSTSDMVFSDGYATQLATVDGSPDEGYLATLVVPV